MAPPCSTFWSSRSALPLAGVPCCGDGSIEVPPRGRRFDAGGRVSWGFRPGSLSSLHRRLLQHRCGLSKVCWRLFGCWLPGGEADPGAGWWLDGGGLGRLLGCPDLEWRELGACRRPMIVHRGRSSSVAGGYSGSQRLWLGAPAAPCVGLDGWVFLVFFFFFSVVPVFVLVFDLYLLLFL